MLIPTLRVNWRCRWRGRAPVKNVQGCYLTRIDAAAINLELRVQAADAAGRDRLRSVLLHTLAQRFIAAHVGTSAADMPSFA